MKYRVVLAALGLGLLIAVVDAGLDSLFFYDASFLELLLTDVPLHELYIRLLILLCLLGAGLVVSWMIAPRERAETRYRTLFDNANDAIYLHKLTPDGAPGVFVEVNAVASQRLDYTREEFLRMTPFDIAGPDIRAMGPKILAQLNREDRVTFESIHVAKDGTEIPVEVSAQRFDLQGEPRVLSVARDIRDRQAAVARIEHLNRVLRAIRNVNQLITQVRDRGRLLQGACDAMTETRGYTSAWIVLLGEDGVLDAWGHAGLGAEASTFFDRMKREGLPPCACRLGDGHEVVVVDRPGDCDVCALLDVEPDARVMSVCLRHGTHVYGVLVVSMPADFSDVTEDRALLQEVADDLGLALHNLEAEARLRDSERRYRSLFERAPIGIFQTTVGGGALRVNHEMARMVGCETPEEAVAFFTDLSEQLYVDPERRAAFIAQLQRDGEVLDFAYRARRRDGEIRWFLMDARLVNGQDGPSLIEGFTRDVTDHREAEADREHLLAQVQQQARQLTQIMTAVPEGVLLVDAGGRVITINPVGRKYLAALAGIGPGEVLTRLGGHSLNEVLTSPPTRGMWHQIQTDGRHFEVIARPVTDRAHPESWVLVVRDVTQERIIQAHRHQQQRLASVGQLAAGIAHDFNNIMAAILLYADLARQMLDRTPNQVRDRLGIIIDQAHQASKLIKQILDFSRRSEMERQVMDLRPFLKEQVKLLERTLPEHIHIVFEDAAESYRISGDPTRLQQVMMNLVLNARDAMPEGGELRITLERLTFSDPRDAPVADLPPGVWIRWSVNDTGFGIPDDVLPHIFEPFFTTKAPGHGSGLGLPQVHGIITKHDGVIDVTTACNQGTCFDLYLPAFTSEADVAPFLESETEPMRGQGERILIVEDNRSVRRALEGTLRALGYQVVTVANGRDALDWMEAQHDPVDLVLSDVVMPEMGGRALLNALQADWPLLPVVLLTGHPMREEMEALVEEGLSAWLSKPPNPVTLARVLREILDS
jgi:two-component system, cell cycle sensor histidine kinase and response regulator CckA